MRRIFTMAAVTILAAAEAVQSRAEGENGCAPAAKPVDVGFSGTFLQLLPETYSQWTLARWSKLFAYFNDLGIKRLVVQWTAYSNDLFLQGNGPPAVSPELETVLDLADRFDIGLYIGLNHDAAYWKQAAQSAPSVRLYLQELAEKNIQLAQRLVPLLQSYRSFKGWYIGEEIDDVNWNSAAKKNVLTHYLRTLAERLHQLAPDKPVALSGFTNAALSPIELLEFWYDILNAAPIEEVFFQDGVGVNKLTLPQLPAYLHAVKWATDIVHRKFYVVVEVFRQVSGPPIDDHPFGATPAEPARIREQMKVASFFSPQLLAFSIPEYMTPEAGEEGRCLYELFRVRPD